MTSALAARAPAKVNLTLHVQGRRADGYHELQSLVAFAGVCDHLGDAYWRVGRKLEAQFQWNHARDLKPEPEDLEAILKKIQHGIVDEKPEEADAGKKKGG